MSFKQMNVVDDLVEWAKYRPFLADVLSHNLNRRIPGGPGGRRNDEEEVKI